MPELFDIYDRHRVFTGRRAQRGTPLSPGEYRIAVQVWIGNGSGQWLISRRAPGKRFPGKWEPTGGCVLAGEDSLQAAVREAKEELGIVLKPESGVLFASFLSDVPSWENPGFLDVWMFQADIPAENLVLQPEEVSEARWAAADDIRRMIDSGAFVPCETYAFHQFLPDCGPLPLAVAIARIKYMEAVLDRVLASDDLAAMKHELAILESYYFGPLWMEDYHADELGRLPPDLKRGVLAEDTVYDLFTEIDPSP